MSYLILLPMWYILGLISIFGTAAIHLTIAEVKGYAACDYWISISDDIYSNVTLLDWLWGLTVWPVRLGRFLAILSDMYEVYDKKSN